ncbi:MAG: hypothetical protein LLF94_08775 [Chlamydiales bacterium]|nr:hypothetical protein [Chlamydiales bacterium]
MFWLIVVAVATVWIVSRKRNAKNETAEQVQDAPKAEVTAYKAARNEGEQLVTEFVRPKTFSDAIAAMQKAITSLAVAKDVTKPDFKALLVTGDDAKKTESILKKQITAAYKQKDSSAHLIEMLVLCLQHVQHIVENATSDFNIAPSVNRLIANLDTSDTRTALIGFLYLVSDKLTSTHPEFVKNTEVDIQRLFAHQEQDLYATQFYQEGVDKLKLAETATDKHNITNTLIPLLTKKTDAASQTKLVELCQNDMKQYKKLLVEMHCKPDARKPFSQIVNLSSYKCPRLPSFEALWDVFEQQNNKTGLAQLKKLAKEIQYPKRAVLKKKAKTEKPKAEKAKAVKAKVAKAKAKKATKPRKLKAPIAKA